MTRIFGHYISLEMALLGAVEFCVSFALIYVMLVFVAQTGAGQAGVDVATAAVIAPAATVLAALLAATIGATAATIGLYRPQVILERRRLLINAAVAGLVAFPAALAVSELLNVTLSHAYLMRLVAVLLAWVACMLLMRAALGMAMRQKLLARRVLVVGAGIPAERAAAAVRAQPSRMFDLVGMLDPVAVAALPSAASDPLSVDRLRRDRVWGLVVASVAGADPGAGMPVGALMHCKLRGVRVFDENTFWERHLGRINLDCVDPDWMVFADGFSSSTTESALRRMMDVSISLAGLLFTLPLMVVVAALVKLDSPGPVLYRQERVGLHGTPFTLLKFRSMRVDAETAGAPRWAERRDPRITRIGAFIRATRIDELPQLMNVLRGEMAFVGPRPERPHFVGELKRLIPFYHERSYVKPGITGWAQVNFPYGASVEDARQKLSYDLYYVKNRSLFLDLLILVSTVRVILFQEGAR